MFCKTCKHYRQKSVENPWTGEAELAWLCMADINIDVCPATRAMEEDLVRGEVVVPCPWCGADLDGKKLCDCGYPVERRATTT